MRARIAAIAAVAAVALAGCGSDDAEYADSSIESIDMEEVFLEAMRSTDGPPHAEYIPDDELIDLGWSGCDVMDSMSSDEFFRYGMDEVGPHADWEGMGALLGAASATLCPEHAGWVD